MIPADASPRLDRLPWLAFTGLTAVLIATFFRPLAGMVDQWNRVPMYSYGYAVPLVSAYLVWAIRGRLAALPLAPSLGAGALVMGLAALLLIVANAGSVQVVGQIGFVVGVLGAALLAFGAARVRASWLAIAYLLLMVPFWDAFTDRLHAPFQNLSAAIGVRMITMVGIPAVRDGIFLQLPGITLEVARACSGINYLVAVLALGVPLCYLGMRSTWRRAALLGTALAVAALSNSLRVALIGVLAYYDVGAALHGPGHVLHGLFVAGIGHAVLLGGLAWLREPADTPSAPAAPAAEPRAWREVWPWGCAAATATLVLLAPLVTLARAAVVPLQTPLETLPREIGAWHVDPFAPTPAAVGWWQPDVALSRRYRAADGRAATLYVGYYEAQRQERELVSFQTSELHRSASLVAAGRAAGAFTVNLVTDPEADGATRLTVFWYEFGDRTETTAGAAKLRTTWNAVVRGRSNGAVVMLTSVSRNPRLDTPALIDFAADTRAALGRCLPGGGARPATSAALTAP